MARMKKRNLRRKDGAWDPLVDSQQTRERAAGVPQTPQSMSPSYRLAYTDDDFLAREELRPVRLQLELLKPEMIMAERGINSTVVMFGGARIPEARRRRLGGKERDAAPQPDGRLGLLRGGAEVCPSLLAAFGPVRL